MVRIRGEQFRVWRRCHSVVDRPEISSARIAQWFFLSVGERRFCCSRLSLYARTASQRTDTGIRAESARKC